ncbi:DNA polymerase III subunit chi [Alteromonas sp. a30]|uniref:DNA polymerase III subunit chi n=1 Tax=Alteromonas sp. a30 TaxID=2730917 RepID=UPI00228080D9|nr:DNA polymerase III subunit chi [Alteromonas sp. a30]MCY7296690.1 DNA polymerase III subunit chi [Alteromonas sp. a30]
MPTATFFLLSEQTDSEQSDNTQMRADPLLIGACDLATQSFRRRQRVWVHCANKTQAEAFDELLWQRPVEAFVPHNLAGEGAGGSPVEIGWQQPTHSNSHLLINLADDYPEFARRFGLAYDFVPSDEARKQQARIRYKHFRMAGFELTTQPLSKI